MTGPRLLPVILLEVANAAGGVANAAVSVTLPWLVLERTDSPAAAGAVAALAALPAVVAAPVAGALVDRIGRRRISVGSDVLSALSVALFPLVDAWTGLTLGWILTLALIGAVFDPAGYTARRALIPDAAAASGMDRDRLNGIHEAVFGLGWVLGPAAGAALIATVGAVAAMGVTTLAFLAAAAAVAVMRVRETAAAARSDAGHDDERFWPGLRHGLRVLWRDHTLRALTITVVLIAAAYMPTETVLLPTWFEGQGEPTAYGWVLTSMSAGGVLGALAYGWLAARWPRTTILRGVMTATAVSILPMALLPPWPVLACLGFLLGLSWGPYAPLYNSLVQDRVPAHVQGRVYGIELGLFYAVPPVAQLVAGIATQSWGVRPVYLAVAGLVSLGAVIAALLPSLRRIDDAPPRTYHEDSPQTGL